MKLQEVAKNLTARGFETHIFATGAEAAAWLCQQVKNKTVGIGGSMSIRQLGLHEELAKENTVYWHWLPEQAQQYGSVDAVRDLAARAEVYLTSANAVSGMATSSRAAAESRPMARSGQFSLPLGMAKKANTSPARAQPKHRAMTLEISSE